MVITSLPLADVIRVRDPEKPIGNGRNTVGVRFHRDTSPKEVAAFLLATIQAAQMQSGILPSEVLFHFSEGLDKAEWEIPSRDA